MQIVTFMHAQMAESRRSFHCCSSPHCECLDTRLHTSYSKHVNSNTSVWYTNVAILFYIVYVHVLLDLMCRTWPHQCIIAAQNGQVNWSISLSRFLEGSIPSHLWYRWNYKVETCNISNQFSVIWIALRVLCHRPHTFWGWLLGIISRKPSQILERNQQLSKDQHYSSP